MRKQFLNYFKKNAHQIFPPISLVPQGDASLLFTSAGMVPFKPYFLGLKKGVSRAASCQKCLRTTDIDRVGFTRRHLTFFEMLGNFSFGDYFKEDAVRMAWEFLTVEAGLDARRLHVTIYKEDDEAFGIWEKVLSGAGLKARITRLGEESNFWTMGPTGPCGPCSEIYFDSGPGSGCGRAECAPGCDCDRYMELWNLVFTQFDRQEDGSLAPLPRKNIDTGMGLERLAMVLENKTSPFETSFFAPLTEKIAELTGKTPKEKEAFRIIGDHMRSAVMLLSEGLVPSNEGRGYILRRLIRRAVRYGRLLGKREAFLRQLVAPVAEIFEGAYPEIKAARSQVEIAAEMEEKGFLNTLETGEAVLKELFEKYPKHLPGEVAFRLYESYGFPLELTREIAAAAGRSIDEAGFQKAQKDAQELARAGWKGSGVTAVAASAVARLEKWQGLKTKKKCYETMSLKAKVLGIADHKAPDDPRYETLVVLDSTPFYPEGGGQVGDRGVIVGERGRMRVRDAQMMENVLIHRGVMEEGTIEAGETVSAQVDETSRRSTMNHHTATHLLNEALRRILGRHVRQAGSLVDPEHLRFDFTHPKALTPEEIGKIESMVNEIIGQDYPVSPQERPAGEVEELGAVTLVGEKYGDCPRFLLIGAKGWDDPRERFSLELCGGTHVQRTGVIGGFKITRQSSVAAGVRRVEAVAGAKVEEFRQEQERVLRERVAAAKAKEEELIGELRRLSPQGAEEALKFAGTDQAKAGAKAQGGFKADLDGYQEREKKLRLAIKNIQGKKLLKEAEKAGEERELHGGIRLLSRKFENADASQLRAVADRWRKSEKKSVVFLANLTPPSFSFVLGLSPDLAGLQASGLAKRLAEKYNGSAGGRPDFAQGGGQLSAPWQDLLDYLAEIIEKGEG